jgi:hypothetical protein
LKNKLIEYKVNNLFKNKLMANEYNGPLCFEDVECDQWLVEVLDMFEEDREKIIGLLTAYINSKERTYEQVVKYIFLYIKEIYE